MAEREVSVDENLAESGMDRANYDNPVFEDGEAPSLFGAARAKPPSFAPVDTDVELDMTRNDHFL